MKPALLAALVLLACGAAQAAPAAKGGGREIRGTVTSVVDGDTVWITPANAKAVPVRLAGIDAPEICQHGGAEAKAYLAGLVLKKPVRLVVEAGPAGHDSFGRTLGILWLDEIEVNRRMVEEGQAWSLRYKWDQGPYVTQERMARALSRGVHRPGAESIVPRDFRQRHGPCQGVEGPADSASAPPAGGKPAQR